MLLSPSCPPKGGGSSLNGEAIQLNISWFCFLATGPVRALPQGLSLKPSLRSKSLSQLLSRRPCRILYLLQRFAYKHNLKFRREYFSAMIKFNDMNTYAWQLFN